ncbi:curli production assembly/transport component CsgF [Sphingobacterium spiritivorum]|uniref:curli production assembly/transport component CsgF n=1 Tax=Sphingobacterium spiritivorum TaxID=258 RepID=UPI003DA2DA50
MKKYTHFLILILGLYGVGKQEVYAQQFVYKPVNPAFGGDTFNYQWLLSSANAQNQFDDYKQPSYKPASAIGSFTDNLNRQILNKISRDLFGDETGEKPMKPGVYSLGTMNITIAEYYGGLNINIIDINTGEQTVINIPNIP